MDPAFFVGKVVLLKWLNDFFDAGYSKVEQTCTGAMHCQILDAIYPGKVPLGKVNFDAKSQSYEHEHKIGSDNEMFKAIDEKSLLWEGIIP